MKSGWIAVALVTLAWSACGGTVATPRAALDAAAHDLAAAGPEVALTVDATWIADAPAADSAAGEVGLVTAAELAYRQFVDAYNVRYRQRLVGCFNLNASTLGQTTYIEVEPGTLTSLRLGFTGWNAAEAARCLEALVTASCDDIASEKARVPCRRVTTGRIPGDGLCLADVDCAEPGHVCGGGTVNSCGGLCMRDLAIPPPAAEGQACTQTSHCQPGLFCFPAMPGLSDGTCRPFGPGIACATSQTCPWPWNCVSGGLSGAGTCGVGRPAGQRCRLWDPGSGDGDSECAFTSTCKAGVCVADPPVEQPTTAAEVPPGGACSSDGAEPCVLGTFCRFDPAELMREPPPPRVSGVCLLWRKPGDSCEQGDACQPGSTCLRGTCVGCWSAAPADGGAPGDASPAGDGGCGAKVMSDPANCGACGRSCQGAGCLDGFCQPRAIGRGIEHDVEGLVVEESGIYLTEHAQQGRVLRVTADGTHPLRVLADRQDFPKGVAVDGTHVYWANWSGGASGSVSRVPKAGGAVQRLAEDEAGPQYVAVDETHVYWNNHGDGPKQGIRRLAKTGGTIELLSAGGNPSGIALDASHVYWAEWNAGTVNRRLKAGGPIQRLATGQDSASLIVLDDQRVYWTTFDHVVSVAKPGGPVSILAPSSSATDLATDGNGGVWWANSFEIDQWPASPTKIVDATGLHQIELRGPWLYYITMGGVFRIAR